MKIRLMLVCVLVLALFLLVGAGLGVDAQDSAAHRIDVGLSGSTAPSNAVHSSLSMPASAVAISGTTAYVGFDTDLHIVDLSTPADPSGLSVTPLTANKINGLDVTGNLLLVGSGDGGLRVVSVATPTLPSELSHTTEFTPVSSVVAQGTHAYTGGSGLGVFSLSDPASPSLLGRLAGWNYNVAVEGDYAYWASSSVGVVSVTNPISPTLVGSVPSQMPYHIDAAGDYAYLADYLGGLKVISTTDPMTPTIVGGVGTSGYANRAAVSGQHAYVCSQSYMLDGSGYLQDISVTDPTDPYVLITRQLPGGCTDLTVDDQHIYLTGGEGLLIVSKEGLNIVGRYPTALETVAPEAVGVSIWSSGKVGVSSNFTVTAYPITVTTPITWTWEATDQTPVMRPGDVTDMLSLTWDVPGTKLITVTAANEAGAATASWSVRVAGDYAVHLPLVQRDFGSSLCSSVPTLINPADGSTLDTLIPLFEWDGGTAPDATLLRLDVAADPDFQNGVDSLWYGSTVGPGNFRFSDNYDPATVYYWRAWFQCDGADGPYSEVWSFTTGSGGTILPAPTLQSPSDGSQSASTNVTLIWAPVTGAQGYVVHWREVGQGGHSYSWTEATERGITADPGTTIEWWVSAYNDYALGADSAMWQFSVPATASGATVAVNDGVFWTNSDGSLVQDDTSIRP